MRSFVRNETFLPSARDTVCLSASKMGKAKGIESNNSQIIGKGVRRSPGKKDQSSMTGNQKESGKERNSKTAKTKYVQKQ
jgi:hypothetical protein